MRSAWGHGYATEAARASLKDVFERAQLKEALSYTSADNLRSQAVMTRLNLQREPSLDYSEPLRAGMWHGMVWVARAGTASSGSPHASRPQHCAASRYGYHQGSPREVRCIRRQDCSSSA